MNIAVLTSIPHDIPVFIDTVNSIQKHLTGDILGLIDGDSKIDDKILFPIPLLKGFREEFFRNKILGIKTLFQEYSEADWFCYLDPYCLLSSTRIKDNLELANLNNIWVLGAAGHVSEVNLRFVEKLFQVNLTNHCYYLMGECQFYHRIFLEKLLEIDFFDKLLEFTNFLQNDKMYDFTEYLYPTLARYFGAKIGVFSTYDEGEWHGSHSFFPIRKYKELDKDYQEMSLGYPVYDYNHPLRKRQRREINAKL